MGVLQNAIDRIRGYFDKRRQNRLERDLNVILNKEYSFNPKYFKGMKDLIPPEQEFSLSVQENYVWFTGKPRLIRQFYRTYGPICSQDLNFFWAKAPVDWRKVHSGIPKQLSRKMATILFGGGISTEIEIFKVDENGNITSELDKDAIAKVRENLEIYIQECDFITKLKNGATTESWSGHVFYKFSFDLDLSEYAILEVVDLRNAEVVKERGITTSIIFKNYYTIKDKNYILKETYTTEEKTGDAMIVTELFQVTEAGENKVPLNAFPEFADIEEVFIFNGLKGMLAFEKPNKLPNNDFLESPYGASDYAGAHSSFDALDETLSEIYAELRNNKTIRYVPDMFLTIDGKENSVALYDNFITNYVKVGSSLEETAKNEINITTIPDKQESLFSKWKIGVTTVTNNGGISPLTLGVTGLESIASSDTSQRERNKATLETREEKLSSWQPFIENMLLKLLTFNSWLQKEHGVQEKLNRIDVDFDNCNVLVKFGDYIIEPQSTMINVWGGAKSMGVASTRQALKEIHPDWSDQKIEEELNLIRFELGMSLDNPMNLPELTGLENEEDELKKLEDEGEPVNEEQRTGTE